jgi:putative SOS response-associated peptidase YedK
MRFAFWFAIRMHPFHAEPRPVRHREPRQPHYIHKRDGSSMAFAGLWETWKGEDETVSLAPLLPLRPMTELHNRMPVILVDPRHFDWWITRATEEVGQLLAPCQSKELEAYQIGGQVNNPT